MHCFRSAPENLPPALRRARKVVPAPASTDAHVVRGLPVVVIVDIAMNPGRSADEKLAPHDERERVQGDEVHVEQEKEEEFVVHETDAVVYPGTGRCRDCS
jgi:hypothetical protein